MKPIKLYDAETGLTPYAKKYYGKPFEVKFDLLQREADALIKRKKAEGFKTHKRIEKKGSYLVTWYKE